MRLKTKDQRPKTELSIDFERQAIADGYKFIAGVDEVGRGCLAGAVVAAAVVLDLSKPLPEGLNDSKNSRRDGAKRSMRRFGKLLSVTRSLKSKPTRLTVSTFCRRRKKR